MSDDPWGDFRAPENLPPYKTGVPYRPSHNPYLPSAQPVTVRIRGEEAVIMGHWVFKPAAYLLWEVTGAWPA